ncbi:MAG: killer suppression protein HigA [bacterium]
MEIGFKNGKLRKLCENEKHAVKELGSDNAKKLRTRLADLNAVRNVSELTTGKPHPLSGNRLGEFGLDLAGGVRITFSPDHDPQPRREDNSIDWSQVTGIVIQYIGDYHD